MRTVTWDDWPAPSSIKLYIQIWTPRHKAFRYGGLYLGLYSFRPPALTTDNDGILYI